MVRRPAARLVVTAPCYPQPDDDFVPSYVPFQIFVSSEVARKARQVRREMASKAVDTPVKSGKQPRKGLPQPAADPIRAVDALLAKPHYSQPTTFLTTEVDPLDVGSDTDMNDWDNYDRTYHKYSHRFQPKYDRRRKFNGKSRSWKRLQFETSQRLARLQKSNNLAAASD